VNCLVEKKASCKDWKKRAYKKHNQNQQGLVPFFHKNIKLTIHYFRLSISRNIWQFITSFNEGQLVSDLVFGFFSFIVSLLVVAEAADHYEVGDHKHVSTQTRRQVSVPVQGYASDLK
jgi:hypothetical protein